MDTDLTAELVAQGPMDLPSRPDPGIAAREGATSMGVAPIYRLSCGWRTAVVAMAIGLSAMAAELPAQTVSTKDVSRRSLPSVVDIHTFDAAGEKLGQGSGFVVQSNGLIVTNYHVIDDAAQAIVVLQTGDQHRVDGVQAFDVQKDYAILKIRAIDLPVLRMGNSDRLEPGEPVIALGAPLGHSGSVTTGTFSQQRQESGYRVIQHSADISPGSSGGPLLLEGGEVVGINTSGRKDGNSLYFALPINYVRAAIADSDGRVMPLADLTRAVSNERTRVAQEQLVNAIREHFVTYRDPEGLIALMVPRGWQVQRNAFVDRDGAYHVTVMAHAPTAQVADLNGWLSDGVRLHLTFPKKGMMFRVQDAAQWITEERRQMVASYERHEVIGQDQVELDGIGTHCFTVKGTSPTLAEPEAAVVYHVFHPKGRAVVELAAPLSKIDELSTIKAVFERSVKIGWHE
jgi:S1-C subfamily serine protease